jgi:hypothetical protein
VTHDQWLTGTDPVPMLEFLRGKATDRKLRLFASACCRHIAAYADAEWKRLAAYGRGPEQIAWTRREAELAHRAAEVAERYADGRASPTELDGLLSAPGDDEMVGCYADGPDAARAARATAYRAGYCARYMNPQKFARLARWLNALDGPRWFLESRTAQNREQTAQCGLLRDIFGDPFRLAAVDPRWLASDVVAVARAVYDDRAFDRLPILADALQDAGCDDDDVLAHCRRPGEHVRGCWVVDRVLGQE